MALTDDSPEYNNTDPAFGSHVKSGALRENFKALEHYDQGRVLSMYDVKAAEGLSGTDLDDYKHRLRVNEILMSIDNDRLNRGQQEFKLTTSAFSNFAWPTGVEQRLDLLYIDRNGDLGWVEGEPPHLDRIPDRPQGSFPIAAIEILADMNPNEGNVAIRQTHIHDVRFTYQQSNVDQMISKYDDGSLFRVDANGDIVEQPQGAGNGLNADTVDNIHAEELQSGIAQWNSAQEGVDLSNDSPFINTGYDSLRLDGVDSQVFLNGQQITFGVHYQVDNTVNGSIEIIDNDLLPLTSDDVAHVLKLGIVEEITLSHAGEHEPGGSDPVQNLEMLRLAFKLDNSDLWEIEEFDTSGNLRATHTGTGNSIQLNSDGTVQHADANNNNESATLGQVPDQGIQQGESSGNLNSEFGEVSVGASSQTTITFDNTYSQNTFTVSSNLSTGVDSGRDTNQYQMIQTDTNGDINGVTVGHVDDNISVDIEWFVMGVIV